MFRLCRESSAGDEIHNYQNCLLFSTVGTSLEFPNLFITIAPAEWKFPMHCSAQAYYPDRGQDIAAFSTIHMYRLIRDTMEAMLLENSSQWFTKVFHYVIRLEYQQRGTIHFHIAIWCIPKHLPSHYKGRTGSTIDDRKRPGHQDTSPFHAYIEQLFNCHVDVQWTTGRLNYINGYTTKGHDAMDFSLDKLHTATGKEAKWLAIYRLLCKKVVCSPEVALWFAECPPMVRSCRIMQCYAPTAKPSHLKNNATEKLYEFYLQQETADRTSFLDYCRRFKVKDGELAPLSDRLKDTIAVGVQYTSELLGAFSLDSSHVS